MNHTVTFINVGKRKAGWSVQMCDPTPGKLIRELKAHRALKGTDIEISSVSSVHAAKTETYAIWLGGFQVVGTVLITPPSECLKACIAELEGME